MFIATSLAQVRQLPVPASIMLAVESELLSAFAGDTAALDTFWQESGTALYLITHDDPPDVITQQDSVTSMRLELATDFPEYVLSFNDGGVRYFLALSIISDEGGGCYLLINARHPSDIPGKLLDHFTQS